MVNLKADTQRRYALLGKRRVKVARSVYKEMERFGVFLVILAAVKLVVIQTVYLSLGFGLQWQQLRADAVQLAVICAVFAVAYCLLRLYVRQRMGRYTLLDAGAELYIDTEQIVYSCALRKDKRLEVTLPKSEIYAVQPGRKQPYLFCFSGCFAVRIISADGAIWQRQPLKRFTLYDIYEPDLYSRLLITEYLAPSEERTLDGIFI